MGFYSHVICICVVSCVGESPPTQNEELCAFSYGPNVILEELKETREIVSWDAL